MCTFPHIIHCWADQKTKTVQFLPICLGEPISLLGFLLESKKKAVIHVDMAVCTSPKSKFYTVP